MKVLWKAEKKDASRSTKMSAVSNPDERCNELSGREIHVESIDVKVVCDGVRN